MKPHLYTVTLRRSRNEKLNKLDMVTELGLPYKKYRYISFTTSLHLRHPHTYARTHACTHTRIRKY